MSSERVVRRMAGEERGPGPEALSAYPAALRVAGVGSHDPLRPGSPLLGLEEPTVSVALPADISAIMAASMELAVAWREATRTALTHYLDRGYEVRELVRGERTSHYLLFLEAHP